MPRAVYGGVEAGERQAVRRERLVEAGLELLGRQGWDAFTVRGVCDRARLGPRYFYESFADREALMVAIFDQLAEEAAATVLEAVKGAPEDARAKARAAIDAYVGFVAADHRRARVLFIEALGSEPLAKRRFQTLRRFADLVADQARTFYGTRSVDDPLVDTAALMLVGGLAEALLAWIDGTLGVDREDLVDYCADLFVATAEGAVRLVAERRRPPDRG